MNIVKAKEIYRKFCTVADTVQKLHDESRKRDDADEITEEDIIIVHCCCVSVQVCFLQRSI